MGEPVKLSAAVLELLSPLVRDDLPPIKERCPDCHLPLHNGKETHYRRVQDRPRNAANAVSRVGSSFITKYYVTHRCTGLDLPMALKEWMG